MHSNLEGCRKVVLNGVVDAALCRVKVQEEEGRAEA